jgi:hypothetical protein
MDIRINSKRVETRKTDFLAALVPSVDLAGALPPTAEAGALEATVEAGFGGMLRERGFNWGFFWVDLVKSGESSAVGNKRGDGKSEPYKGQRHAIWLFGHPR